MALGNAINSRPDGGAMFANPALVAQLPDDEFFIHNTTTSLEKSNTFTLLIRSEVAGTFAVSFRLLDHGDQEALDPSGNPTGTLSHYEQVLAATYATPVGAGLHAGISYKLYQDRYACQGFCGIGFEQSATTHGIDVGVQYRPTRLPALSVGASLVHFGFPLQVENKAQADPTPARIRLGGAYEVMHHVRTDSIAEVWISADLVQSVHEGGAPVLNVGAEALIEDLVFLWGGYGGGEGLFSGLALGVGLKYNRFDVAVAKSFVSTPVDDQEPFSLTFGVRF
jgi:hypothetical protein